MRYLLVCLVLLLSSFGLWAKPPVPDPSNITARIFKGQDGRTLPYRVLKPAGYDPAKKYPLVLCLHGAGGRGQDNQSRGCQAFETLSSPQV